MREGALTSRSSTVFLTVFQARPAVVRLQNLKKYSNHAVRASPHASPPETLIPCSYPSASPSSPREKLTGER
eukprot:3478358-Amphidinium_carterae.1